MALQQAHISEQSLRDATPCGALTGSGHPEAEGWLLSIRSDIAGKEGRMFQSKGAELALKQEWIRRKQKFISSCVQQDCSITAGF